MDDKTLDQIGADVKAVAAAVAVLPEDIKAAKAEIAELKEHRDKTTAQLDAMAKDVAEYRATLKDLYGRSGAMDWKNEFQNFIKAVYHVQKGLPVPQWLTKAVADYVVTTDAQGGYLVPTLVGDAVNKLTLRHGQLWPLVTKVTVPDGVNIKVPYESTLATTNFVTAQGVETGYEVDPFVVWGNDTLNTRFLRGVVKIANEALKAPGISIGDEIAMQAFSDLIRKIEYGLILGDDSALAYPHDGILVASSVNSQTTMATVTVALVATFIAECLADHEGSGDTSTNYLITTDAAAYQLKSGASATGANPWGDPSRGIPANFNGYPLVTSPHSISTTHRMIMAPLPKIKVGWSGSFGLSFNESLGWASNETWMMAYTHADWALGNPDMYHKAVFTALA